MYPVWFATPLWQNTHISNNYTLCDFVTHLWLNIHMSNNYSNISVIEYPHA